MWALFAVGAGVVGAICYAITIAFLDKKTGVAVLFGFMTFLAGVAVAGCALISLIRFVKWVWG